MLTHMFEGDFFYPHDLLFFEKGSANLSFCLLSFQKKDCMELT